MKKALIAALLFILIGGWMIRNNLETDFDDTEDTKTFAKTFAKWVAGLGRNMASITGYVIGLDWKPNVETNSTKND